MAAAVSPIREMLMESCLPKAVSENWTVTKYSEATKSHHDTASKFLRRKLGIIRENAQRELFKFSPDAGALVQGVAVRQLERLRDLEMIPKANWTKADLAMEKHAMNLLKPLMEWAKIPVAEPTKGSERPQISDSL